MSRSWYISKTPDSIKFRVEKKIEFDDWVTVIEQLPNYTWFEETHHGKEQHSLNLDLSRKSKVYIDYEELKKIEPYNPESMVIKTGKYSMALTMLEEGYVVVKFFKNENPSLFPLLLKIANALGVYLLMNGDTPVGQDFLSTVAGSNNELSWTNKPVLHYSFGNRTRWMAIKTDKIEKLVEYLMVKEVKKDFWDKAFADMTDYQLIITPCIAGWTFVTGARLERSLPGYRSKKDGRFNIFIKELERLSAIFGEVQWYENHDSYGIKAYAQFKNGDTIFGSFYADGKTEVLGKIPPEVKKLNNPQVTEVAKILSLDPTTFVFIKELQEVAVRLVEFKD